MSEKVYQTKNSSVTAIIQARMQSKRLPGKSMKELAGKPLIAHVIERARSMSRINKVVIATCPDNDLLVEYVKSIGIECFVGSESNVLERYTLAAREFGGDYIVRITGDNPFTDVIYGDMAIDIAVDSGADLGSLSGLPLGAGIEVIRREALETAFAESTTSYQKEHVTPYIKEHAELFSIQRFPVTINNPFPDLRLTVDTPEDFEFAQKIYEPLYAGKPFGLGVVIEYLCEHPALTDINRNITQRPMTHSE
jgi:spore coat polysaccharide biosynthesis protein SpsF